MYSTSVHQDVLMYVPGKIKTTTCCVYVCISVPTFRTRLHLDSLSISILLVIYIFSSWVSSVRIYLTLFIFLFIFCHSIHDHQDILEGTHFVGSFKQRILVAAIKLGLIALVAVASPLAVFTAHTSSMSN